LPVFQVQKRLNAAIESPCHDRRKMLPISGQDPCLCIFSYTPKQAVTHFNHCIYNFVCPSSCFYQAQHPTEERVQQHDVL